MTVTAGVSNRWHHNRMSPITFGLLYNGYAVVSVLGLSPAGWHIPTSTELDTMVTFLSPSPGGKLKEVGEVHWCSPNTGATNSSGFTAIPAGHREYSYSTHVYEYSFKPYSMFLWASTFAGGAGYTRDIRYSSENCGGGTPDQKCGLSVRCVRDTNVGWVAGEIVTDYDGNEYNTTQIGTQIWTVQNLAVTHYRDGTVIPEVANSTTWTGLVTGALCTYNNDWSLVYF
jgi:uncharacterized protein (TIGR02145 family)